MFLNAESIQRLNLITPFASRAKHLGLSYGCGVASYDLRLGADVKLTKEYCCLGVSFEEFNMPTNVCGFVKDKSSWARNGLSVFNTFIDPGWSGFLTLEFSFKPCSQANVEFMKQFLRHDYSGSYFLLPKMTPIAQVVFGYTENTTGYIGKYQNQDSVPQHMLMEF